MVHLEVNKEGFPKKQYSKVTLCLGAWLSLHPRATYDNKVYDR